MGPLFSFAPTTKFIVYRQPQQASAMALRLVSLNDFRLPDHPDARLQLDRQPLCIADVEASPDSTDASELTAAIGIATVLYNWCPDALSAFLDLDAWFSFTWSLAVQQGEADETNIEIGRVGNQITVVPLTKMAMTGHLCLRTTYPWRAKIEERGYQTPRRV
jgi:hypothetical protein